MLAAFGFIVQPTLHPLAVSLGIKHTESPVQSFLETPPLGIFQILLLIGFLEFVTSAVAKLPDYAAGDYLGCNTMADNSDVGWRDFQERELSNGRLAMLAAIGFGVQEALVKNSGDLLFKPLL